MPLGCYSDGPRKSCIRSILYYMGFQFFHENGQFWGIVRSIQKQLLPSSLQNGAFNTPISLASGRCHIKSCSSWKIRPSDAAFRLNSVITGWTWSLPVFSSVSKKMLSSLDEHYDSATDSNSRILHGSSLHTVLKHVDSCVQPFHKVV